MSKRSVPEQVPGNQGKKCHPYEKYRCAMTGESPAIRAVISPQTDRLLAIKTVLRRHDLVSLLSSGIHLGKRNFLAVGGAGQHATRCCSGVLSAEAEASEGKIHNQDY